MCHLFASQNPDSYVYETRSIRLNGQKHEYQARKNVLEHPRADRRARRPVRSQFHLHIAPRSSADVGSGSEFYVALAVHLPRCLGETGG
jgi:hypothetical protein